MKHYSLPARWFVSIRNTGVGVWTRPNAVAGGGEIVVLYNEKPAKLGVATINWKGIMRDKASIGICRGLRVCPEGWPAIGISWVIFHGTVSISDI
jgi:hypothetical protein